MNPSYQNKNEQKGNLLRLLVILAVASAFLWYLSSPRSLYDPEAEPRPVTARGDLVADEQNTIDLFESTSSSVVYITSIELRRSLFSLNYSLNRPARY